MHDPTGRVYRLTQDGRLTYLIDTIPSPNGIVVDPEETALLVAVDAGEPDLARAAGTRAASSPRSASLRICMAARRPGWFGP